MSGVPDFAALRRQGLSRVQRLSGQEWSDYNTHDPGVTLLEQFCFAVTELGYRAGFSVSDLLADPDGSLSFEALGLHTPGDVLATRPVTPTDLALALEHDCPSIRGVLVYPGDAGPDGDRRGLYDLYAIPEQGADDDTALAELRAAFHRRRNLCEDLGGLDCARPRTCRVQAEVEVRRRFAPEQIAARIYLCCARLMDGSARGGDVTRAEAFEAPERLFGGSRPMQTDGSLELFHMAISALPEVERVVSLAFVDAEGSDPFAQPLARGEYRELVTPHDVQTDDLRLTSRGLALAFDPAEMARDVRRLRAAEGATRARPVPSAEWDRQIAGEPRRIDHVPLSHGLPAAFGVGPLAPPPALEPGLAAAADQLRGYLALCDAPLANATADLADLRTFFRPDPRAGRSYALDTAALVGGGAHDPRSDAFATLDPWRDRKGRVLDYLLALYGESFSQNSLQAFATTADPTERRQRVLDNRAALLREIAALNRDRSAGANFAESERSHAVGLGRKLTLLLDLPDRPSAGIAASLDRLGLRLGGVADAPWRLDRRDLGATSDPFDTLVPKRRVAPLDAESALSQTAWLADQDIPAVYFRRGARRDAYLLDPVPRGWRLTLDPGDDGPLAICGTYPDRDRAIDHANALAGFMNDLNRSSEGFYLVEDILLRGRDASFLPLTLTAVFAGWSARSAQRGFRFLAAETLGLLCPAHIAWHCLWLEPDEMAVFETAHLRWRVAFRDAALTPRAEDAAIELERAGAGLRHVLSDLSAR